MEEAGTVQGEGYIRQRRDHQAKGEENKVIMDCYPRVYECIGGVFTSIHQQSVRDKFSKIESYSAVIPSKQLHPCQPFWPSHGHAVRVFKVNGGRVPYFVISKSRKLVVSVRM